MPDPLTNLIHWIRQRNHLRLLRRRLARGETPPELASVAWRPAPINLPVAEDARIDPRRIPLPSSETPIVSIIVPAYGKADVTLRCLASLHRHPPQVPFEVLVVEDCSGELGANQVGEVPGVRFTSNPANLGFLRTCNAAARAARGSHLLLLNNDTQVLAGAVEALLHTFDTHPRAGLVGAKLVYPDGRLQEAGGILWSDGSAWNYGRGRHPDDACFNFVRETDYIAGAAIMIERALWEQLGGFDERFCPAYCEDSDFAMQVREAGRQVIYQHEAVVVHLEGVSNGTDENVGVKHHQVTNSKTLAEKWRHVLERDHFPPDAGHEFKAREHAKGKPVLLLVDTTMIHPDADAGSRTIAEYIDTLLSLGWLVKFWPEDGAPTDRYAWAMRRQGIEVLTGAWRLTFPEWIARHGRQIDAFLLSRPTAAAATLADIRRHSTGRVVFYGHDIHHARLAAQAATLADASAEAASRLIAEIEQDIWRRADVVLYPSQAEADEVRRFDAKVDARAIQPYCFDTPQARLTRPAVPVLQFVAGFGHPPNVDAAQWLVQQVMPLVWQRRPGLVLRLVGSKPTADVLALAGPLVEVTGWVSHERLSALYEETSVSLAPLRFGAGVKLKVVEALAHALPLVTTPVGAQGLEGLDQVCEVHESPQAFADAVLTLLDDEALWRQRSASAATFIGEHFSRQSMRREMAAILHCRAD